MPRAKAAPPAIRFTADFDHVEVGRTVAYKAGHVVEEPDAALVAAAGGKAERHSPEAAGDGE